MPSQGPCRTTGSRRMPHGGVRTPLATRHAGLSTIACDRRHHNVRHAPQRDPCPKGHGATPGTPPDSPHDGRRPPDAPPDTPSRLRARRHARRAARNKRRARQAACAPGGVRAGLRAAGGARRPVRAPSGALRAARVKRRASRGARARRAARVGRRVSGGAHRAAGRAAGRCARSCAMTAPHPPEEPAGCCWLGELGGRRGAAATSQDEGKLARERAPLRCATFKRCAPAFVRRPRRSATSHQAPGAAAKGPSDTPSPAEARRITTCWRASPSPCWRASSPPRWPPSPPRSAGRAGRP